MSQRSFVIVCIFIPTIIIIKDYDITKQNFQKKLWDEPEQNKITQFSMKKNLKKLYS